MQTLHKNILAGALVATGLIALLVRFSFSVTAPVVLRTFGPAPAIQMTDSLGRPFDSSSLKGKVWIFNFFFTSCPTICPAIHGRVSTINRMYKDNPEVALVSLTVDPETDTPALLKEYSERFKASPDKWFFLTGPAAEITKLRSEGFKLDDGMSRDVHTTRVVLIDRKGDIRGFYRGDEDESMRVLARDIQVALESDA